MIDLYLDEILRRRINGKVGDSLSLYAGYGYKHLVFHCIKMGVQSDNKDKYSCFSSEVSGCVACLSVSIS